MVSSISTPGSGGVVVTDEMRELMARPGFLKSERGGERFRELYQDQSSAFEPELFNSFAFSCYVGELDTVKKQVEAGTAPDLTGTETAFQFGYCTMVVAGAQRVQSMRGSPLQHYEVLKYLLSCGAPPDVPDIAGSTALHHATMSDNAKIDLARLLLENGANVNHQDRYGCIALENAFQTNQIAAIELLMEFGADVDRPDADGLTCRNFCLMAGPQVTAAVYKWLRKRTGEEAPREEKKCDNCGIKPSGTVKLRTCSSCHTVMYCSSECQRQHWRVTHKNICRPFSASNTVTLKPRYEGNITINPTATMIRESLGIPTDKPKTRQKYGTQAPKRNFSQPKPMVVKVQVPYVPASRSGGPLIIYTKKRDFACSILRADNPTEYDRIAAVVRSRGVGGGKAYFPAELKSKDELVVKIDQTLAEQPF